MPKHLHEEKTPEKGATALMLVCAGAGGVELVQALLDHKSTQATLGTQNQKGMNAYDLAASPMGV